MADDTTTKTAKTGSKTSNSQQDREDIGSFAGLRDTAILEALETFPDRYPPEIVSNLKAELAAAGVDIKALRAEREAERAKSVGKKPAPSKATTSR